MTPKEIYEHHRDEAKEQGRSQAEQHAHGLRHLNHAGYFKGPKGWTKIHPDLREKVEVREAFPQPDGTFAIYDVTVFYPNAVKSMKGIPEVYTADDIRQIISNTNFAIAHEGGQKPGILEGHPNIMQAAIGTEMDVHGFAVNWRESPRGAGWAMCDLIHVDPEYVDRLKKKKLTGMSAYIAEDNEKLNRRFGHVALLGGSTAALSHLPMHDVYESCCFSAQASYFQGEPMKLTDKQKQCFAAAVKAGAGYAAAEAAFGAKEPGAEMKMNEAAQACYAASSAMKGAFSDMPAGDGTGSAQPAQDVPAFDADGKRKDLPTESGLSLTDQNEPQQMEFSASAFADIGEFDEAAVTQLSSQFAAGHVNEAFTNMLNIVKRVAQNDKQKAQQIQRLAAANQLLQGNAIREDYRSFCTGLRGQGFEFDDDMANSMFSMAMANPDKLKALEKVKTMLQKMPKRESLAGVGQIFSASDTGAPKLRTEGAALTQKDIEEMERATGRSYSEADMKIGAAFSPDVMLGHIR